eukprot:scaffold407891_cov22-Prasinocladus_malaysianus.AAC.1
MSSLETPAKPANKQRDTTCCQYSHSYEFFFHRHHLPYDIAQKQRLKTHNCENVTLSLLYCDDADVESTAFKK